MSDGRDDQDLQETVTVDDLGAERSPTAPYALLVYHRGGADHIPLSPGVRVVVGRSSPADLVIDDQGLSRQHARIELIEDEAWIEDLGSKNGTRVNGLPRRRVRIVPGDEIKLGGGVTAVLHRASGADPAERLESHDQLLLTLEREVVRARLYRRSLALVLVRGSGEDPEQLHRWHPAVRRLCRRADRLAQYGPSALQIMMPEATAREALSSAEAIVERGRQIEAELRCGAAVFPDSAGSADELLEACREAARRATTARPVQLAPGEKAFEEPARPIISSPAMTAVYQMVEKLSLSALPVLILGETGTGKEVIARAIHEAGPRRSAPMRCLNCGAIPEQLTESVLFGHERGAFTGADQRRKGIFEQAHGGTVLLDEVGELSLASQVALLRVLETGLVTRVGSESEIEVDVRVIAATNRDLEAMNVEGAFRSDLLYRLNAATLQIPPLRERPEEIPTLAEHFLERARRGQPGAAARISPGAAELIQRYSWPGNVRELRNVVERAVVVAQGEAIEIEDLSERVRAAAAPERSCDAELVSFRRRIQRYEMELIAEALRESGWNQSEAARRLNMPLRTMVRKIGAYGIRRS